MGRDAEDALAAELESRKAARDASGGPDSRDLLMADLRKSEANLEMAKKANNERQIELLEARIKNLKRLLGLT